jgi:hypothetical protein
MERRRQREPSYYTDPADWRMVPKGTMDSEARLLKRWGAALLIPVGVVRLIGEYTPACPLDEQLPPPSAFLAALDWINGHHDGKPCAGVSEALRALHRLNRHAPDRVARCIAPIRQLPRALTMYLTFNGSGLPAGDSARASGLLMALAGREETRDAARDCALEIAYLTLHMRSVHGVVRLDAAATLRRLGCEGAVKGLESAWTYWRWPGARA